MKVCFDSLSAAVEKAQIENKRSNAHYQIPLLNNVLTTTQCYMILLSPWRCKMLIVLHLNVCVWCTYVCNHIKHISLCKCELLDRKPKYVRPSTKLLELNIFFNLYYYSIIQITKSRTRKSQKSPTLGDIFITPSRRVWDFRVIDVEFIEQYKCSRWFRMNWDFVIPDFVVRYFSFRNFETILYTLLMFENTMDARFCRFFDIQLERYQRPFVLLYSFEAMLQASQRYYITMLQSWACSTTSGIWFVVPSPATFNDYSGTQ